MIKYMDRVEDFIRLHIGFEVNKGSFEKIEKEMLRDFSNVSNPVSLYILYKKYLRKNKKGKS